MEGSLSTFGSPDLAIVAASPVRRLRRADRGAWGLDRRERMRRRRGIDGRRLDLADDLLRAPARSWSGRCSSSSRPQSGIDVQVSTGTPPSWPPRFWRKARTAPLTSFRPGSWRPGGAHGRGEVHASSARYARPCTPRPLPVGRGGLGRHLRSGAGRRVQHRGALSEADLPIDSLRATRIQSGRAGSAGRPPTVHSRPSSRRCGSWIRTPRRRVSGSRESRPTTRLSTPTTSRRWKALPRWRGRRGVRKPLLPVPS